MPAGTSRRNAGALQEPPGPGAARTLRPRLPAPDTHSRTHRWGTSSQERGKIDCEMETILVVDDEAPVRSLARDILVYAGYRVLEAEDGAQALRLAEEHQGAIHVLLTDLMMSGINGKELADRLASLRPDTKMIFMSGRASEVITDAGVLVPVDAFLAKPFTADRLRDKWRR